MRGEREGKERGRREGGGERKERGEERGREVRGKRGEEREREDTKVIGFLIIAAKIENPKNCTIMSSPYKVVTILCVCLISFLIFFS